MIKELKYVLYLFLIFIFIFFSLRYYISDEYKKKTFRSIKSIDELTYSANDGITILNSDTDNIIEYVDRNKNENKKEYKFWELLKKN